MWRIRKGLEKLFNDSEQLKIWGNNRKGLQAEFPQYELTLRGAIDDLLIAPNGKFIPFDFKTRGYPIKEDTHEHYQHQLDLYALLFEKNGHPSANYGYLLFFYPKSYSKNKATFITELVKMTVYTKRGLDVLKKVNEIVSGRKPQAHVECAYCAYRKTTT